jgi:tetratricopeptide (TPR) repeat protein
MSRPKLVLALLAVTQALAQPLALRDAVSAMQRGDFATAERQLRAQVAAHPNDALALSLLGAALDNLKRLSEAAVYHQRAVAITPPSADVLNNYAAHLWIAGKLDESRKAYLRVLAIDPAHADANLQLTRAALQDRNGAEALRYLDRLPERDPQLLQLRLEALSLSGQYDKAQTLCEAALKNDPANFALLYNLGVVATYAGHYDRAREALDAALRREPQNVDVLVALARADAASRQPEAALRVLARATQLAPDRTDVIKLLAMNAADIGAVEDAAAAWDRYLKLQPNDDEARRERSYLAAQKGELERGIAGLEAFVARHPRDVVGHYELGQAHRASDSAKALREFDRALELDPKYAPARAARGSVYYQEAQPALAVKDLEIATALRPEDAESLDRLGQAYAALDRSADALGALRRAAGLAPDDSKILLHYGRALADAGRDEEAKAVMDRFRRLGPEKKQQVPAGFVAYLGMTQEQRRADYRARVEKQVAEHPDDAAARLSRLKLLIDDRNWEQVAADVRALPEALLADAGRALLVAKQHTLAIAAFERLPESARPAEYYLALLAAGKSDVLDQALRLAPPRPEFYAQAGIILTERNRPADVVRVLDQGARVLPTSREILLLHACALEWAGRDAAKRLSDLQARWPEWYPVWIARSLIAKSHGNPEESRRASETATALGAPSQLQSFDWKRFLTWLADSR